MLRLSAPMVGMFISFTVMQFVDRLMVSCLGTAALAAILPAGTVSFIPATFVVGIMSSVNTFASQSLGRSEKSACANYFWQAVYIAVVYLTVVLAIMVPAAPAIFRMLGQPAEVIPLEVTYLRIVLLGHLISAFIWAGNNFFMGIHRPRITMLAAVCGNVTNAVFNYLLIFGKFGCPRMEVAGAAWGTVIGIVLQAGLIMAVFLGAKINSFYHSRCSLRIDLRKMADIFKVGLPAGLAFIVNVAFFGLILFGLVGQFGQEALAATSAVFSCVSIAVVPVVGLAYALTAAVGKSIGEGKKGAVVGLMSVCLRAALLYAIVAGVSFFVFRVALMRFWSSDDKVIAVGVNIFILAAVFQVFDSVSVICNGALRGAGDTMWLAGVSATGSVFILGGGVLITNLYPACGALGPWIAATINVAVMSIVNVWRFRSNRWMRIDLFKGRASLPGATELIE